MESGAPPPPSAFGYLPLLPPQQQQQPQHHPHQYQQQPQQLLVHQPHQQPQQLQQLNQPHHQHQQQQPGVYQRLLQHHQHHQNQHHQHQHQHQDQHHRHRQQGQSSHVNGKGLWSSWERSFRQPLDALLDLVDNTIDAHSGRGCIRIDRGLYAQNYNDECIQIMNSVWPPTKRMNQILNVFDSDKEQQAIGENGVGIKQASAGLSNFSMCITKNETIPYFHKNNPNVKLCDGMIEVGFLSKALQTNAGVELPSYTFPLSRTWLVQELEELLENDAQFAECLAIFGDKDPDALPPPPPFAAAAAGAAAGAKVEEIDSSDDEAEDPIDRSLQQQPPVDYKQQGLGRLMDIIDTMTGGTARGGGGSAWSQFSSVFCLVLARLRVAKNSSNLLKTLQAEMPKTYIHLQPDQIDIRIDGKEIQFQYWERRLVELTVFPICVSRSQDVVESKFCAAGSSSDWVTQPPPPFDNMNVYCGFDAMRAKAKDQASSLTLYIYSRQCGRLVKCVHDARRELDLNSGSTEFSAGLTVILDDTASTLPLTPTKQDIAWTDAGDQGEIHRKNVYAWLRGVVNLYYRYWKEHYFYKSKEQLTTAVVDLEPRVVKFTAVRNRQGGQNVVDDDDIDQNINFCPLQDTAQFNCFTGFHWTVRGRPPHKNLTVTSFKEIKVCQRKGSLLSFPPQPKAAIIKPSPKAAPKPAPPATPTTTAAAASSGRRRNSDVVIKSDPDECSLLDDDVPCAVGSSSSVHGGGSPSSSPRKQRAKRRRASDDDDDDDAELLEEVLRQDDWKQSKRELENTIRRLQLKVDRLENDEKQLTSKLEQSERARKSEHATASPRQAKDLIARHAAAVAELNRQVEHQKEAKRKQAALHAKTFVDNAQLRKQIVQLQEENRKLQEAALATATNHQAILASTMATANALRDELALVKQNSVTQDEQFDDDVDDDNSDSV